MKLVYFLAIITCLFFSSKTADTQIFENFWAIDPNRYTGLVFPPTVPKSVQIIKAPPGSHMAMCMTRIIQKALIKIPEFGKVIPLPTFDVVTPNITRRIEYTLISNGPNYRAYIYGSCDFQTITAFISTATFKKW